MKEDIQTYVEFYLEPVRLSVYVNNDLTAKTGSGKNLADIVVSSGFLDEEDCFWDNITFFLSADKKKFKKQCKEELEDKGFDWKDTYKKVKILLEKAVELKILSEDGRK